MATITFSHGDEILTKKNRKHFERIPHLACTPRRHSRSLSMLGNARLIAFSATRQPDKARAFYEKTLGLRFVEDSPFALVFDANGTMLRVQKVPEFEPQPFSILGWTVPDACNAAKDLAARGVVFERYGFLAQDDLGVWTSPDGAKVAWFKDPDGNTLSIAQM
jgi:catechol 2,3-dioxygenase-like lactoylglutathione lyase family enzyme